MASDVFDVYTGTSVEEAELAPRRSIQRDEQVEYSEELFRSYRSSLSTWRRQVEDDRDFASGAQWRRDKKKIVTRRGQKALVIDVLYSAIEQAVAMLTANDPRFTATAREDSDVRVAQMFAYLMSYVWDFNRFRPRLKTVIRDYYVASVGWAMIWWDEFAHGGQGEIKLSPVDPRNVFVDPNSKDLFWDDAAHIIVANVMTAEQVQQIFPSNAMEYIKNAEETTEDLTEATARDSNEGQGSGYRVSDTMHRKYLILDRYSRVKVMHRCLYEQTSGWEKYVLPDMCDEFLQTKAYVQQDVNGVQYFVDPGSVADASQVYETFGPVFHMSMDPQTGQAKLASGPLESDPQSIPESQVSLTETTLHALYMDGIIRITDTYLDRIQRVYSLGGVLVFKEVIPVTHYPLVPLINNFDRTVQPISDVRRVKGLAEYINDVYSLIVAHAESTTNFKVGYPRGGYNEKQLVEMWNRPGTTFIPYDAELGQLTPLQPAPLPSELYKTLSDAIALLERILGIYAMMQGDPSDAPNTFKGTVALDEYGQRRIKSKKDDIEDFLNQLAAVMVEFMQSYYNDYRVRRIVKPNGKNATLAVNVGKAPPGTNLAVDYRVNDISTGKYDVIVVSGSMLPSNRWALLQMMTELYKLGILDQQTLLEKTEVADPETVLERIGMIKMLQERLAQAEAQIKDLSGDLQTARRESVHAAQRVEEMKFKTDLDSLRSKAEAGTELYLSELMRNAREDKRKKQRSVK